MVLLVSLKVHGLGYEKDVTGACVTPFQEEEFESLIDVDLCLEADLLATEETQGHLGTGGIGPKWAFL